MQFTIHNRLSIRHSIAVMCQPLWQALYVKWRHLDSWYIIAEDERKCRVLFTKENLLWRRSQENTFRFWRRSWEFRYTHGLLFPWRDADAPQSQLVSAGQCENIKTEKKIAFWHVRKIQVFRLSVVYFRTLTATCIACIVLLMTAR